MIDIRTKKEIHRLIQVVVNDSLMDANFEYVQAAINEVRRECDKTEKYMQRMDKIAKYKKIK
jgi:hypothetical protein